MDKDIYEKFKNIPSKVEEDCDQKDDQTVKGIGNQNSNTSSINVSIEELKEYQKYLRRRIQECKHEKHAYITGIAIAVIIACTVFLLAIIYAQVMSISIMSISINVPIGVFIKILNTHSQQTQSQIDRFDAEYARVQQVMATIQTKDDVDSLDRQALFTSWNSQNSWNS